MFKEINVRELDRSPIQMISDDWALLTAGKEGDWNTMTVSWGGVGELWGKDVVFVFVRPQRYTLEFMEKYDEFTLSFFDGEYKKELGICGAKSGRDIDKAAETGLVPEYIDNAVTFKQAKKVLVCKKVAFKDMTKNTCNLRNLVIYLLSHLRDEFKNKVSQKSVFITMRVHPFPFRTR